VTEGVRSTRGRKSTRAALLGLLLCVAASVSANVYLVLAARHYFQAANAIRLDPAGLEIYAAERSKPSPPGAPLLVLFGDSRAAMWPEPPTLAGYVVVNRGIGNQTTAQLLLRVGADVEDLRPAVVVIEAGVNDLKTIVYFPERQPDIIATCKANLEKIVARCRRTGATVVLATVFDIGHVPLWRRPFWSYDVSRAVREVNTFLAGLSGGKVLLFDAGAVLRDPGGEIRRTYQLDHLHLSPAGYAALNRPLEGILQALPK
jgi:lysophospholipase L1-like esterase